jgi:hypothetical protein
MGKLSQDTIDAIGAAVAAAFAAQAAAGAPVKVTAPREDKPSAKFGGLTFTAYVAKRNASRKPCAIESHTPETCNRTFGAGSGGDVDHVAQIVA